MQITHEDVLKELVKRTNLPYEQLRVLFVDYNHQIKQNLMNPENNFTKGIKIRNSIKFRLNPKRVIAEWNSVVLKRKKNTQYAQQLNNYIKQLLDAKEFTKGQEEFVQTNWRLEICEARSTGDNPNEESSQ